MTFKDFLREKISENGLTQNSLATIAGSSSGQISKFASKREGVSQQVFERIASALGMSADELSAAYSKYESSPVSPSSGSSPLSPVLQRGLKTYDRAGGAYQEHRLVTSEAYDEILSLERDKLDLDRKLFEAEKREHALIQERLNREAALLCFLRECAASAEENPAALHRLLDSFGIPHSEVARLGHPSKRHPRDGGK